MKGDLIPDEDHVMRYCGGGAIVDGSITGVAFRLRENDEYLSVNWLEFLRLPNRESEVTEIRRVLASKLTIGSKAKLAILNVGKICNDVRAATDRTPAVIHEPEEDDPSHSGIHGLLQDDDVVEDLLAELVEDSFPAQD